MRYRFRIVGLTLLARWARRARLAFQHSACHALWSPGDEGLLPVGGEARASSQWEEGTTYWGFSISSVIGRRTALFWRDMDAAQQSRDSWAYVRCVGPGFCSASDRSTGLGFTCPPLEPTTPAPPLCTLFPLQLLVP